MLEQPGLVRALELLAAEGSESAYRGALAEALLELMDERGGLVTREDLHAYRGRWVEPVEIAYSGTRFFTRGDLSGVPETLARLPVLAGLSPAERALALVGTLDGRPGNGHTTSLTTVDPDGNACVLTTSLGLGSGDFLPGLDLHLNSMLGESDLIRGPLEPGERMGSMMAPSLALDPGGLVLAIGAAGGTRLRSALVQVAGGILDEGLDPQDAVSRPRLHAAARIVQLEPGFDADVARTLEAAGYDVRVWPQQHHYFGGVSAVARTGRGRRSATKRGRRDAASALIDASRRSCSRFHKVRKLARTIRRFRHLLLAKPPPEAAAQPAFARRPGRSLRPAPPRSRTLPRRASAATARARAAGRRDRPRSRAGTPRRAAPPRRSAGSSRSRWLHDGRLRHRRRCRAQGRAAPGRPAGSRSETPACLRVRRRRPPGPRPRAARPSRRAARSISPARSRSRIRLEETPFDEWDGADVEAQAAEQREIAAASTAEAKVGSGDDHLGSEWPQEGLDERLRLELRKLQVEVDHQGVDDARFRDQLEAPLEGRQELDLVAEGDARMRVEGDDRRRQA